MALTTPSRDYSTISNSARIKDHSIYIGFIKDNSDAQRMGRLSVWIPEMGGNPDLKESWLVVSYASPFAGATNPQLVNGSSQSMSGSQESYGFWMVPPDINNQVLVAFVNGDAARGYWFACLWQQNMNHMIPGIACNVSTDSSLNKDNLPPVVEYNKLNQTDPDAPRRPPFTPLAGGLSSEGLTGDPERGPSSTSARREAPSKVFGFLTPDGNTVHVDDNPSNEFIRMRTKSGTQILIHETTGYVYINSKLGNSWFEVSDQGINMYSSSSISIRSQEDFNIRADRNIILDAGGSVLMKSGTDVNIQTANNFVVGAIQNIVMSSTQSLSLTVGTDMNLSVVGDFGTSTSGNITQNAGGVILRTAPTISDNGTVAPIINPSYAKVPQPKTLPDISGGQSATVQSIVSVMPTHEPWRGHPNANIPVTAGDNTIALIAQGGAGQPLSDGNTTSTVQTGTGPTSVLNSNTGNNCATGVGTSPCSNTVWNSIQTASSQTGVPFGNLMAIADVESKFNANATNPSSASGLFQFVGSTWSGMVSKYGSQYNVPSTSGSIFNPTNNAIMGGAFYNQNETALKNAGISNPSVGQVYMAHMLGSGSLNSASGAGAIPFIQAYQNDPNTPISSLSPALQNELAENPLWSRGATTVGQVYQKIDGTMNAKASLYDAQAGLPAPCSRSGSTSTTTPTTTPGASSTGSPL